MASRMVKVPTFDGKEFSAYFSLPPAGVGPGLLLLQDVFGVNAYLREAADRYAAQGWLVLAPEMFWQQQEHVDLAPTLENLAIAGGFSKIFDDQRAIKDMNDALTVLRTTPGFSGKAAALGFCLGGRLAFLAAAHCRVRGAVCYYPTHVVRHLDDAKRIKCPMLFECGETDQVLPPESVEALRKAMAAHPDSTINVYPGAGHGFANWMRPDTYNAEAFELSNRRALEFLKRVLK